MEPSILSVTWGWAGKVRRKAFNVLSVVGIPKVSCTFLSSYLKKKCVWERSVLRLKHRQIVPDNYVLENTVAIRLRSDSSKSTCQKKIFFFSHLALQNKRICSWAIRRKEDRKRRNKRCLKKPPTLSLRISLSFSWPFRKWNSASLVRFKESILKS